MTVPTAFRSAVSHANGGPEVSAAWLAANPDVARVIDVREPHELVGPLGQTAIAENVPMLSLLADPSLDAAQPLVLICRSGRRSALVARELAGRGFDHVASVAGGMLAWHLEVLKNERVTLDERAANATNLADAVQAGRGIPEVSGAWVAANLGRFRFVDVREPYELSDGFVPQAQNIPLRTFMQEAGALDREEPMVIMCASGNRSGQVVYALKNAGFQNVANLEGGMYGWRLRGLPHA